MPNVNELEKLALDLGETDRARLATSLIGSLSPVLDDLDDGIQEALRRDAELDANPEVGISIEELDRRVVARRQ